MKVEAAPTFRLEPALNLCTLVRAVVIHDQVDFLIRRQISLQVVQEADEFLAPVALLAGSRADISAPTTQSAEPSSST